MKSSNSCDTDCDVEGGSADVIIIGGGLSGLIAACKIFQVDPSIKIMILESTEILGGQIYKTYCSQDLGAKFIKKEHCQVIDLLEKFSIPVKERIIDQKLKGISTFQDGRMASLCSLETKRFLQYLDFIAGEYKYGHFEIVRTKSNSMESYINRKLLFPKSKNFARLVVRLVCGTDAEHVTMSEFLAACSSCGSSTNITDLYFGRAQDVLEFDTNELLETLMCIVNDHVLVKTKSHVIDIFFSGEQYMLRDSLCRIYKSRVIVLAVPWNAVIRLDITPVLPLHCRIPFVQARSLISSFCARYKKPHWRDRGLSGSLILDDPEPLICFETDPITLCGFVLHNGESLVNIPKIKILERLEPYFGEDIRKTSSFAVRCFEQSTILNHPQTEPFLNMVWASSCGAITNRGLLSGSIDSGFRAAANVVNILRPELRDFCEEDEESLPAKKGFFMKFGASLNLKEGLYFSIATVASMVTFKIVQSFIRSNKVE